MVELLVDSGDVRGFLGEQLELQMRLFVKQGPFYVQVQPCSDCSPFPDCSSCSLLPCSPYF